MKTLLIPRLRACALPTSRFGGGGHPRTGRLPRLLLLVPITLACGADPAEDTALVRGDRAFAGGNLEEALAEYRLALLQDDPGTTGLVRAAHAYAALARVDEARSLYEDAVLEDSAYADQAAADFVSVAKRAVANGDNYGAASAMEAALAFRPGLVVEGLALPLARHYSASGEYGRALPLYLLALGQNPADLTVVFETALAHEEIGDCKTALVFFEEYSQRAPRSARGEVGWHVGSCSYQLSQELLAEGRADQALRYVDAVIEVGEPRTLLPQAYFERGQILSRMGQCALAIEAYREVPLVDPSGTGPLARRARDRVDEIRFGRGDRGRDPC